MVFNSLTFVVFFAIVLALHNLPFSWRAKKINLLIASYVFYAAWNPPFTLLLVASTILDWYVAHAIHREQRTGRRRALLALSIAGNLGILGYFKYGEFLLANWQALMASFGIAWQAPGWDIVLPVGISFYTFQTMAYSLDVYLRRAEPGRSFLDFALFVTFFPQLVAGPIVRPTQLVPQFEAPRRATRDQLVWGLGLMTLGMFEKIVFADGAFAPAVDSVYDASKHVAMLDAWLGTLAFSGQIFCDFAGYSTTAIGAAMCLGFALPNNFNNPYAAIGFSDFWRRWHISLSTWLRDYLYVPLGGNRRGDARTYVNLLTTMLIGGLWHGANWTFVVWGGLHGAYLAIERWARTRFADWNPTRTLLGALALALLTYLLVNLTWVFFRAPTFAGAGRILESMLGLVRDGEAILPVTRVAIVIVGVAAMLVTQWLMRERSIEQVVARTPPWLLATGWGAMLFLIAITQGGGEAFIYFQF